MYFHSYNYAGINSEIHAPHRSCDDHLTTDITLPDCGQPHIAQSVGPGASVDLGEGAKRDAPLFVVRKNSSLARGFV